MKHKRLSAQKHTQIIRCFCADITATACAEIVGVRDGDRNMSIFAGIANQINLESQLLKREVEHKDQIRIYIFSLFFL